MGSLWDPEQVVVDRLCELVRSGCSVRAAAGELGLSLSVAYRLAHEYALPLQRKTPVPLSVREDIKRLWCDGLQPMDIARCVQVGSSVVYRIGMELGLWKRHPHGRRAGVTSRRCEYLYLRVNNAVGRKDAATACGIHRRDALDIDKGLIKSGRTRIPFIPDGPDAALYNRLMQLLPYVHGRTTIPVQVIPQERIDQRISDRYLSIEEREIIYDLLNKGEGVRAIARHLGRSPGTISKELKRNKDDFGLYPSYLCASSIGFASFPAETTKN